MDSQLFFLLNLIFGGLLAAWFLSSRRDGGTHRPTQLNLRKGPPPSASSPPSGRPAAPPMADQEAESWGLSMPPANQSAPSSQVRETKTLNVLFMYNGHDWDAYAVLGVPAGASLPTVTKKYQELVQSADRGKLEFYEAAYQAILKRS